VFCGCAPNQKQVAVLERKTLVPGDCIVIDVILDSTHRDGLKRRYTIDALGEISLPLLGKLHVAGLSLSQTEDLIERAWANVESFLPIHREFIVSRCR
jgi:protein involved in polysaccharide export with SLBB domain